MKSNWTQANLKVLNWSLTYKQCKQTVTAEWLRPTYCVSFTEASGDHIVHVAVFTELQLRQVHLHLAVLHKHTLFHHLQNNKGNLLTVHII